MVAVVVVVVVVVVVGGGGGGGGRGIDLPVSSARNPRLDIPGTEPSMDSNSSVSAVDVVINCCLELPHATGEELFKENYCGCCSMGAARTWSKRRVRVNPKLRTFITRNKGQAVVLCLAQVVESSSPSPIFITISG